MAGGSKVREWMRKRMAPRKATGAGAGSSVGASEASPLTQSSAPGRNNKPRFSSALRWRRPHGNVLAALFHRVAYHLLWLVESVVVVARLVAFFLRFGFKL